MSRLNEYTAASEHNTALHRRTSARDLADLYPMVSVPVSGDMLRTLAVGTRGAQAKRRMRALLAMKGDR